MTKKHINAAKEYFSSVSNVSIVFALGYVIVCLTYFLVFALIILNLIPDLFITTPVSLSIFITLSLAVISAISITFFTIPPSSYNSIVKSFSL